MIVTLLSDMLTVHIDTKGAQLTSVATHSGTELLWQADPKIWGRHAPILFPIIGRLRDNRYTVHGKEYQIGQHGFARDKEFAVVSQSSTSVTFQLEEDAQTLEKYPFAFRLLVTYTLEGGKLTKRHTVRNQDTRTMYYEVGGHDGFRTTLFEGESMEDYYIEFPGMEHLVPFGMNEKNHLTREDRRYEIPEGRFPLPPRVFGLDTIVLENLPVTQVTLANTKNPIRLTMDFGEFPYLGIWTQNNPEYTHYICIEPWTTLPECAFTDSALEHKPGIRVLEPGQEESLSYSFTVSE